MRKYQFIKYMYNGSFSYYPTIETPNNTTEWGFLHHQAQEYSILDE